MVFLENPASILDHKVIAGEALSEKCAQWNSNGATGAD
jgi:hypothetical protein